MSTRTISNVAEELIPRNKLRQSMSFQNEDSAINVFIKREPPSQTSVSATNHDAMIPAGGSLELDSNADGEAQVCDRWTIIAASGTPRISIIETEIIDRQYGQT